ncbi:uncharacterized protein LOC105923171 [Fundulus heteroclitus]|uniref:uncharacterized protein LOC105923171 n=1 Tax=Fundulus heteroclitus TaxID=8078 RepID=UPI00165B2AF6|nr:uncharacterized protein LOC105923171 [Fundulus heteroclitus]
MMECIHVAVVLFSLLSLGQSAPATNCDILTQPIQLSGRDQLLGRWNYMAESTDLPGYTELSKMFTATVWRNLTAAAEENVITSIQYQKMFGLCYTYSYNMTLENNALVLVHPYPPTTFHLNTGCPDCMVVYSNYTIGKSSFRSLQLLSRRSQVSAAELEEYKKQAECLNLPGAVIMDVEKGFCPDPSLSKDTKITDLTSIFSTMGSDDMDLMDKILRKVKESSFFSDAFSKFSNTVTAMFEN